LEKVGEGGWDMMQGAYGTDEMKRKEWNK
jgi:hypothetical protein